MPRRTNKDGGGARHDDRRMDEVLRGDDPAPVDPALASRLQAFFGTEPEPEPEAAGEFVPGWGFVPAETAHDRWRRERAIETAGRGTLWRSLAERAVTYGEMVEPLPPMSLGVEEPISPFELARWGIPDAPQISERERPDDLWEALRQPVPQAVLRDLHRTVIEIPEVQFDQHVLYHATGEDQTALVRSLVGASYRVDTRRCELASVEGAKAIAALREQLAQPWEDARPENPTPWTESISEEEIMRWFQ